MIYIFFATYRTPALKTFLYIHIFILSYLLEYINDNHRFTVWHILFSMLRRFFSTAPSWRSRQDLHFCMELR